MCTGGDKVEFEGLNYKLTSYFLHVFKNDTQECLDLDHKCQHWCCFSSRWPLMVSLGSSGRTLCNHTWLPEISRFFSINFPHIFKSCFVSISAAGSQLRLWVSYVCPSCWCDVTDMSEVTWLTAACSEDDRASANTDAQRASLFSSSSPLWSSRIIKACGRVVDMLIFHSFYTLSHTTSNVEDLILKMEE